MASDNKLQLIFVVNGTKVPLEVNVNRPLQSVLGEVLEKGGVVGDKDLEKWFFKYNEQTINDPNRRIGEFGFPAGALIFVNLKAGHVG
jgi:hypothetical protein